MSTSMTLREALHGESGALDQLSQWLAGERPKRTFAQTGSPERAVVARSWFTLDGHTVRELVFEETYPDPTKMTPEATILELEDTLANGIGTRPVGLLEIQIYETGRSDWPGVKLQRKLRDSTEADVPMSTTFLRGEVARLHRENERLVLGQQAAFTELRILASDQATTIANIATVRATTSAGADMSSPWAPIGMMMLFVLVPVAQRALGLKAGASLEDTVERLVDLGKKMAAKQAKQLDDGTPSPPLIPPGAGGDGPPLLTDDEALTEGLKTADLPGGDATAEALGKLMVGLQKDPMVEKMFRNFAKEHGVDPDALFPHPEPEAEPETPAPPA